MEGVKVKQAVEQHPASAARRGETTPARQDDLWPQDPPSHQEVPSPQLPHEHDESSHSQVSDSPQHRPIGEQAYDDTTSDRADTDKGPVMDEVYHRMVDKEGDTGHRN
jgi:hypothetical protein